MAGHDDNFDVARLERMERRLQSLEDAEATRNLKARYAALCDDNYDADRIAGLFAEDAKWDSPGLGRFEGREKRFGDLLVRDPLQLERPDPHRWRYRAGAVVPAHAVHRGGWKPGDVACGHRP